MRSGLPVSLCANTFRDAKMIMKTPIRQMRWWVARRTAAPVGSLIPARIFKRYSWQVIGSRCRIAQYRTGDEGMLKQARIASLSIAVGESLVTTGSFADAKNKLDNRSLFVVRPDGRIAYVTKPFKVLTPSAYSDLAAVVDSLAPPAKADSAK